MCVVTCCVALITVTPGRGRVQEEWGWRPPEGPGQSASWGMPCRPVCEPRRINWPAILDLQKAGHPRSWAGRGIRASLPSKGEQPQAFLSVKSSSRVGTSLGTAETLSSHMGTARQSLVSPGPGHLGQVAGGPYVASSCLLPCLTLEPVFFQIWVHLCGSSAP